MRILRGVWRLPFLYRWYVRGDWRVCTFELLWLFFGKKVVFPKITPSLFTLKEGSTSHPCPLSSGAREKTALLGARNRYALRLVGHQSPRHICAGWDRLDATGDTTSTAFDVVQKELKYLGLWKFAGAVMYVLHEALGLSEENMIAPIDEKRGKLLLAEILNGGNFGKHFTKYGHFTQQGMAKKYFLKIWRNMHFVRYYPAEALSEPIFRTWHFFWRMWNKKYKLDYQRKNQLS